MRSWPPWGRSLATVAPTNLKMALSTLVKIWFVCLVFAHQSADITFDRRFWLFWCADRSWPPWGEQRKKIPIIFKHRMPPFQIQTTTIACTRYLLNVLQLPSGATYDGTFSKGLPNGIGVQAVKYRLLMIKQHFQVMRFPDSSRYEGEFMQVEWLYFWAPCAMCNVHCIQS